MVCVAVSALTRLVVSSADVINVDEASYMVGASELLRGHVPYTAFGDNKPPLIYTYYALAQLIGGTGIGAVRLLTALVTVPLTAWAITAFYGYDRRGMTGALLFLVYSASYTASDMLAVNCEVVMMLPLAWALVAVADPPQARHPGRTFVAGALTGLAALVKYQAGLWMAPLAVTVALASWQHRRAVCWTPLVTLTLGALLPVLATLSVFATLGGLEDLLYWNVTHNLEYLQNPIGSGEAIRRGLTRMGPFLLVTAPLWYGWLRSSTLAPSRHWEVLLAGLVGASAAAACLGLRFFPHYFVQLYVPLSIGAAPWVVSLFATPARVRGFVTAAITVLLWAGWTLANASRLRTEVEPTLNTTASTVAARLRSDACFGDSSIFVWGSAPEFYYHARLPLASRFFFPEFPLVRYYAGNPAATAARMPSGRRARRVRHWTRLMADLRTSRPTFILDTAPAGIARWQHFPVRDYPLLHHFIARHYTPVDVVSGVRVYRRNECEPFVASATP